MTIESHSLAQSTDTSRLGSAPVGPLLFRLALPAVTAQIVNVVYNVVDRVYIGRIPETGSQALTGIGVVLPLIMGIAAFTNLISMGGAPRASINLGRKDRAGAEKILGSSFLMLLILAVLLTAVMLLFGKPVLMAFGASEDTLPFALEYMNVYAIGIVFVQLSMGLNAFISAQGYAALSMATIIIGALLNIILDPIFIFAFDMGVQGAALATVLSQAVSTIWVLIILTGRQSTLNIRAKYFRLNPKVLLPCLALGLSPFIMGITTSMISIIYNISLQSYGGDIAVGAMTIFTSAMQFLMVPVTGLTQGSQPIISYNYGALNSERVRKTFALVFKTTMVYSTLVWALCVFAPGIFVGIFTNEPLLADFSAHYLRLFMASSLILGIQVACQQTFVALGVAKASILLALLRKFGLLMPLILLFPAFFSNKVFAVFLAEPVADLIAATVTGITFFVAFKRILKDMDTERSLKKSRIKT